MKCLRQNLDLPNLSKSKLLPDFGRGTAQTGSEASTEAVIDYKVTSNGSAVVETLFPGTPHEMISVYHDNHNGKLTMTHYCAFGNQPKLDLVKLESGQLDFELSPSSDIPAGEDHMHSLKIAIEDNKLTQTWTCEKSGKPGEPTVISVEKI